MLTVGYINSYSWQILWAVAFSAYCQFTVGMQHCMSWIIEEREIEEKGFQVLGRYIFIFIFMTMFQFFFSTRSKIGHCQTAIGWTSLGLSYTGVDFYNLKDLSNRMTIESGFYRVLFLYHYTHVHHWVGEALHRELGLLVHLTLKAY